ncbi:MAG: solute:sodium symporter family transporter, partial [Pseudomonadota bacterium]
EGLWQIIRIFTGFYNIPIVAIVIVGLFAKRTPAIAAKIVIVFHVITYGLLKFIFDDVVTLHFLHLYAILFVMEVAIMLTAGKIAPRETAWVAPKIAKVDLTPWRFARPVAFTLLSCVVGLYLVFSPIGFANGEIELGFMLANIALLAANIIVWVQCFYALREVV